MSLLKRLFGKKSEPTDEEIIEIEDQAEWQIRQNRIKRAVAEFEGGILNGADPDAVDAREAETKDVIDVLPTYYEYDDNGEPTGGLNGHRD